MIVLYPINSEEKTKNSDGPNLEHNLYNENNPEEFFLRIFEFSTDDLIKKVKNNKSFSFAKSEPFSIEKLIESYDPNSEFLSPFEIYQESWIKILIPLIL